jgi:hypothetical protein
MVHLLLSVPGSPGDYGPCGFTMICRVASLGLVSFASLDWRSFQHSVCEDYMEKTVLLDLRIPLFLCYAFNDSMCS